jgi:hypothetical protein
MVMAAVKGNSLFVHGSLLQTILTKASGTVDSMNKILHDWLDKGGM